MVRGTDFGLRQAHVQIVFCPLWAKRFGASHLMSLGPDFFFSEQNTAEGSTQHSAFSTS